jgi:hypothetical protein
MIGTGTVCGRVTRGAVLVAALTSVVAGGSAARASPQQRLTTAGLDWRAPAYAQLSSPTVFDVALRLPVLSQAGGAPLGDIHWTKRTYTTSTGETVEVSVSPSYPEDEEIGQRWADFFASLVHGPELLLLKVYVASLSEVHAICGGGAVGCYGDRQLILTDEPAFGFSPEEVARHEYGHHIALNRSNAPWPAFDWGPKRWATAAHVCSRVRWNDAYPGDESLLYKLNPGEAFAEAYRVLVDIRLGEAHPVWPLVDPSFYPDQTALDAIEQDIVSPWIGPTAHHFHLQGRVWVHRVASPLDGTLTVQLAGPAQLELTGDDGQAMRPTRRWGTTLTYQVCGQRSVTIRATPDKVTQRVNLEVVTP